MSWSATYGLQSSEFHLVAVLTILCLSLSIVDILSIIIFIPLGRLSIHLFQVFIYWKRLFFLLLILILITDIVERKLPHGALTHHIRLIVAPWLLMVGLVRQWFLHTLWWLFFIFFCYVHIYINVKFCYFMLFNISL